MQFLLSGFGVGVSCRILYSFVIYLYVSFSGLMNYYLSWGRESKFVCYRSLVVMWFLKDFLFLLVLGMACVILLWHSLSLPYN